MFARHAPTKGFTIVELLIVIVVIGVLAGISIVAFTSIQQRTRVASYTSSLSNISKLMEITHVEQGSYPNALTDDIRQAGGSNVVRLVSNSVPVYENLSPIQRGVLFQDVCSTLIAEGYGGGTNQGGQDEQYISSCNVYGNGAIQINGWHAHNFSVPIATADIYSWYDTHVHEETWRPDKKQAYLDFATELAARYMAHGGAFPVTSFWDPWAAGVPREELPEAASSHNPTTYCIEISHPNHSDEVWHVRQGGNATEGACS